LSIHGSVGAVYGYAGRGLLPNDIAPYVRDFPVWLVVRRGSLSLGKTVWLRARGSESAVEDSSDTAR
jgi:hypothetical protein